MPNITSTINLLDCIHSSGQDNEIQNTGCIIVCETRFRSGSRGFKIMKKFHMNMYSIFKVSKL